MNGRRAPSTEGGFAAAKVKENGEPSIECKGCARAVSKVKSNDVALV